MTKQTDPRTYLAFLAKITSLLAEYSRDDLAGFRTLAEKSYPAMASLIAACMDVAVELPTSESSNGSSDSPARRAKSRKPLLDLLCSTELFPTNSDLIAFSKRALPEMSPRGLSGRGRRFIADRVVSHLEAINGGKREQLEQSMREVIESIRLSSKKQEPQSFFSQWEKIIKGMGR